jgi:hypothetical protein
MRAVRGARNIENVRAAAGNRGRLASKLSSFIAAYASLFSYIPTAQVVQASRSERPTTARTTPPPRLLGAGLSFDLNEGRGRKS